LKEKKNIFKITENNAIYIIAGLVFITYVVVLKYPFIQDDWGIIYNYFFNLFSVENIFLLKGKLFFRPLGQLYTYLYLLVFGIRPFYFHLFSLVIHIINSYLVFRIIREVFPAYEFIFALKIGCLYAAASSIHIEPLLWLVGIYETGSTFFYFLSIFLFVKSKNVSSAISFAVGICFKESGIIFVPAVLLSLVFIYKKINLNKELLKLLPHFLVFVIFILVRINMASPLSLPNEDPYKMVLFSPGLITKQLFKYTLYSFQSVFPYGIILIFICSIALAFILVCGINIFRKRKFKKVGVNASQGKDILFMLIWCISGISSVFFLVNHTYRYYLTLALPAIMFLFVIILLILLNKIGFKNSKKYINVVFWFSIVSSVFFVYYSDFLPYTKYRLNYGTNGLISRGKTVELISKNLIKENDFSTGENIILLDNFDIFSFDKNSGPCVWLKNKNIKIYDLNNLRYDSSGFFIENPIESQGESYSKPKEKKIQLDSNRTYVYLSNNNTIEKVNVENFKNYKIEKSPPATKRDLKDFISLLLKDF
jgi:hypothetical protein